MSSPTTSVDIHVRAALTTDVPRIVEFQLAMAWETERMRLDKPTVERGVQAVFADASKGAYWMAEIDRQPVGVLLTIPEWSDWRNGTVLWLHSVYVAPEQRGRGVFRRLYAHIRAMVEQSSDLRGLRLYVDKRNGSAQAVYRSLGMTCDHYDMYEWLG